jgi:hypothetical protein
MMPIMHAMKPIEFEKAVTVKTCGPAHNALRRAVVVLKASDAVRWRGREATLEAVVNASWLYLADLDDAELERIMAIYIPRLEAVMGGGTAGASEAPADVPDPPPGGPILAKVKQANPAAGPADPRPAPRRRRKNG